MKKLIIAAIASISACAHANVQLANSCLKKLDERLNVSAANKVFALNDQSVWFNAKFSKIVLQQEERSLIFVPKLKEGKNAVYLRNRKGKKLAQVCLEKSGGFVYIQSVNETCANQMDLTKNVLAVSPAATYENMDLLGDQIFHRLRRFNANLERAVNAQKCDAYVDLYSSCAASYNKLASGRKIAAVGNRYQYALKEMRLALFKTCGG